MHPAWTAYSLRKSSISWRTDSKLEGIFFELKNVIDTFLGSPLTIFFEADEMLYARPLEKSALREIGWIIKLAIMQRANIIVVSKRCGIGLFISVSVL